MPKARHVWFKRAYKGLYGNRMIQFGNQVSFAENKTRRTWKPNVQKTTLFSKTLQERFRCSLTTHVMRCIRKAGGFDEYLIKTKDSEIKFDRAIALKERIIEARKEQQRLSAKAMHMGPADASTRNAFPSEKSALTKEEQSAALRGAGVSGATNLGLDKTSPSSFRSRGLLDIL